MSQDDIRQKLQDVFRQVFGREMSLRDDLTPADVEGWDSLVHVTLIVAVEREFGVRFTGTEIANTASVGGIIDLIAAKLAT